MPQKEKINPNPVNAAYIYLPETRGPPPKEKNKACPPPFSRHPLCLPQPAPAILINKIILCITLRLKLSMPLKVPEFGQTYAPG